MASTLEDILELAQSEFRLKNSIQLTVRMHVPSHCGFGTGTSIRLACLELLFLANTKHVTEETLIRLSRRGGASGVGIQTYFYGGMIFDVGRENDEDVFRPSATQPDPILPLTITNFRKSTWKIGLCIPKVHRGLFGEAESSFFRRICPIGSPAVHEATYHICCGFVPAFMEGNDSELALAIDNIQATTWKAAERAAQAVSVADVEYELRKAGARGVGMSSLGPTLYFMGSVEEIARRVEPVLSDWTILPTSVRNIGRDLK